MQVFQWRFFFLMQLHVRIQLNAVSISACAQKKQNLCCTRNISLSVSNLEFLNLYMITSTGACFIIPPKFNLETIIELNLVHHSSLLLTILC